jgi:hypothetical protein
MGCARVRLKTVTASLRSVVRLQRMRRGNVFVSTRRRSKACEGRVDVRRARVIFARASSVLGRARTPAALVVCAFGLVTLSACGDSGAPAADTATRTEAKLSNKLRHDTVVRVDAASGRVRAVIPVGPDPPLSDCEGDERRERTLAFAARLGPRAPYGMIGRRS